MPLPPANLDRYIKPGKLKETAGQRATAKAKPKPYDPFGSPLPSLQAIRDEAKKAAQAEIQAALGALPREQPLRNQAANTVTGINAGAQQATADIGNLARFGVDEQQGRINALPVSPTPFGDAANPTALSAANLLGAQGAATGNTLNATAAATRLLGNTQAAEVEKSLLDQLFEIGNQRAGINATAGKVENETFQKLREFYLNIAGAKQQNMLAESELGLNAAKLQNDAATDAANLQLDQAKLNETKRNNRTNNQIALDKLRMAGSRLDLDYGRLALDQGKAQFDQWYKEQRLEVNRWSNRIKQTQVQLAIDKAKTAGTPLDRKAINGVFNNIDSMFDKRDKTTREKITSYNYTFYGNSNSPNPNAPPVKAFTVRGTSFEDAFAKARNAALSDGYNMPKNWHEQVGATGEPGAGPVWREERRDANTETITRWNPRFKPDEILQTSIRRLEVLGFNTQEATQIAGAYVKSLIPLYQLNLNYGGRFGGRATVD